VATEERPVRPEREGRAVERPAIALDDPDDEVETVRPGDVGEPVDVPGPAVERWPTRAPKSTPFG